jgi:hypothetical protein
LLSPSPTDPIVALLHIQTVAGYALYGFLTMAMDSTAALLIALMDLHIVPAFDKPWRSLSLTEFWGRCGWLQRCCELQNQIASFVMVGSNIMIRPFVLACTY